MVVPEEPMRELSPEIVEQLVEHLNRAAAGTPARDKPAEGAPVTATVREAIVETGFLVAAVDGDVSPLELVQFAEAVEAVFGADADAQTLVKRMADRLGTDGWARRVAAVHEAIAGTEHAETAYRLAAAVAFVDDMIEHAEAAALEALARAFGLSEQRAHAIMTEVRTELFGD
jgi:tellurite resistance protein